MTILAQRMKFPAFLLLLFISFDSVEPQARCVDNTVGFYPKCECKEENYGYSENAVYTRECVVRCPSISDGDYPNCKCRYGSTYDNVANSCPSPKCPANTTSDSVYPNCKCTSKNYEYNEYLNECYLVCPDDSSGFFPDCRCVDRMKAFNKDLFACMKCPSESSADSIYPNCQTDIVENATFIAYFNEFRTCHVGSYGIYPNCTCENGNVYHAEDSFHRIYGWRRAGCLNCPGDLKGDFPNCECPPGESFNGQRCKGCAWNGLGGVHPNCICPEDSVYEDNMSECRECPPDSNGTYPNCVCNYPLYYRRDWNRCIDCPEDSTGVYPNCSCHGENAGLNTKWSGCETCPKNSTGRFPNCRCTNDGDAYDPRLRYCGPLCEDGVNIHPNCECETYFNHFIEKKTRKCRPYAYPGRRCPPNAIGRSPDCHCVQADHFFIPYGWGCFTEYSVAGKIFPCKNGECYHFQNLSDTVQPKGFFD